jgi:hypothetical protein
MSRFNHRQRPFFTVFCRFFRRSSRRVAIEKTWFKNGENGKNGVACFGQLLAAFDINALRPALVSATSACIRSTLKQRFPCGYTLSFDKLAHCEPI